VWATRIKVDYRIGAKKFRNVSQASIDYTSIACCLFALESLIKRKKRFGEKRNRAMAGDGWKKRRE
jgi:hypothetical protein